MPTETYQFEEKKWYELDNRIIYIRWRGWTRKNGATYGVSWYVPETLRGLGVSTVNEHYLRERLKGKYNGPFPNNNTGRT